jgi:hypothetical protein
MDDPNRLEVLQPSKQLNGKPPNEAVLKSLVVIHLDKLIEIDAVEVENKAEMVTPYKVVGQLDHPLHIIGVVLLEQQK